MYKRYILSTVFLSIVSLNFFGEQNLGSDTFQVRGINVEKVDENSDFRKWLDEMHQKYPTLGLDKVVFVHRIDQLGQLGWGSIKNTDIVICPRNIEQNDIGLQEFCLLHELGHIKNANNSLLIKINNSLATGPVIRATIIGSTIYIYKTYIKDRDWSLLKRIAAVVAIVLCKACVATKLRFWIFTLDEKYADKFANQNGDYNCLQAGLKFFKERSWYPRSILEILGHPRLSDQDKSNLLYDVHPHSIDRAKETEQAIQNRFNFN